MIYLILLSALILRLVNLDQSLWLDEAINVNAAVNTNLKNLITIYSLGDFHPPLYHILLNTWVHLVGYGEQIVRIPSVFFALINIFMAYLIAKKLYEQKTALICATLLAFAPLHIYYSQEARMYMLAATLVSISVYFFISLLKSENISNWVGFITSSVLMLYADYLPYLMVPVYIIFIVFMKKRIPSSTLKTFLPAFLLIIFLILPWLFLFPSQLSTGLSAKTISPSWASVVGSSQIKDFVITFVKFTIGRISHDNNLVYSLLFAPVALFISLLFLMSLFRMSNFRFFLWLWFFLPICFSYLLSFIVPIHAYFRLIFVLPAFYLILASAINTVNMPKLTKMLLIITLAINLISTSIYYLTPKFQRENWRQAVSFIKKYATPQSIVLFESSSTFAPFDYYNKSNLKADGALSGFSAEKESVSKNVEKLTRDKNQIFLFQYLSGITDPQGVLFEQITSHGFFNYQTLDFSGVGLVYVFKR